MDQVHPTFTDATLAPGLETVCPQIGKGAYGEVFKAIDPSTNDMVAVKMLACTENVGDFQFRFNQETTMQQLCSPHPNVCGIRCISSGPAARTRSIVMDYSDISLHEARKLQLAEPMLRCIAVQLLAGVQHMHGKSVVHRDIKPRNLLMDYTGLVRVTDFGLAGLVGPDLWFQDNPNYVVTDNYRPPDLLLKATSHGYVGWAAALLF